MNKKKIMAFLAAISSFSCNSLAKNKPEISANNSNSISDQKVENDKNKLRNNRLKTNKKTNRNNIYALASILGIPTASTLTWYLTKHYYEVKGEEEQKNWENSYLFQIAKSIVYNNWAIEKEKSNIDFSEFITNNQRQKIYESIENLALFGMKLYNIVIQKSAKKYSNVWTDIGSPNVGQMNVIWAKIFQRAFAWLDDWEDIKKGNCFWDIHSRTEIGGDIKVKVWVQDDVLHLGEIEYIIKT